MLFLLNANTVLMLMLILVLQTSTPLRGRKAAKSKEAGEAGALLCSSLPHMLLYDG